MATQQNPSSLLPFFRVPCTLESYYTVLFPHLLASKCMFMGADHASLTVNPQRQLADSNQCDSKFWFKLWIKMSAFLNFVSNLSLSQAVGQLGGLAHIHSGCRQVQIWAVSQFHFKILVQFAAPMGKFKSGLFQNFASICRWIHQLLANLAVSSPALGQLGDTTKWSGSEGTTVHITVEISTILQLLQFAGASCNFQQVGGCAAPKILVHGCWSFIFHSEPTPGTGGFKSAPFHNFASKNLIQFDGASCNFHEPTAPTGRFKSVCFEILVQIFCYEILIQFAASWEIVLPPKCSFMGPDHPFLTVYPQQALADSKRPHFVVLLQKFASICWHWWGQIGGNQHNFAPKICFNLLACPATVSKLGDVFLPKWLFMGADAPKWVLRVPTGRFKSSVLKFRFKLC
ncbi:hypothetical protein B0H19DRAFT_1084285 [Mycena capillaripes]|nr:hypothetical protein B0H19DRAFT_1084285 [Mycena capillaripes]